MVGVTPGRVTPAEYALVVGSASLLIMRRRITTYGALSR
jgi:hypothetical protein